MENNDENDEHDQVVLVSNTNFKKIRQYNSIPSTNNQYRSIDNENHKSIKDLKHLFDEIILKIQEHKNLNLTNIYKNLLTFRNITYIELGNAILKNEELDSKQRISLPQRSIKKELIDESEKPKRNSMCYYMPKKRGKKSKSKLHDYCNKCFLYDD